MGDNEISGYSKDLRGTYSFRYETDNRVREGFFTISGEYNNVDINLADFILLEDITVEEY